MHTNKTTRESLVLMWRPYQSVLSSSWSVYKNPYDQRICCKVSSMKNCLTVIHGEYPWNQEQGHNQKLHCARAYRISSTQTDVIFSKANTRDSQVLMHLSKIMIVWNVWAIFLWEASPEFSQTGRLKWNLPKAELKHVRVKVFYPPGFTIAQRNEKVHDAIDFSRILSTVKHKQNQWNSISRLCPFWRHCKQIALHGT